MEGIGMSDCFTSKDIPKEIGWYWVQLTFMKQGPAIYTLPLEVDSFSNDGDVSQMILRWPQFSASATRLTAIRDNDEYTTGVRFRFGPKIPEAADLLELQKDQKRIEFLIDSFVPYEYGIPSRESVDGIMPDESDNN